METETQRQCEGEGENLAGEEGGETETETVAA